MPRAAFFIGIISWTLLVQPLVRTHWNASDYGRCLHGGNTMRGKGHAVRQEAREIKGPSLLYYFIFKIRAHSSWD